MRSSERIIQTNPKIREMKRMTVKQYAESRNVTPQLISRYLKQMEIMRSAPTKANNDRLAKRIKYFHDVKEVIKVGRERLLIMK